MTERSDAERMLLERVLPWVATSLVAVLVYVAITWRGEMLITADEVREVKQDVATIRVELTHLERNEKSRGEALDKLVTKVDAVHDALLAAGIVKPLRGRR